MPPSDEAWMNPMWRSPPRSKEYFPYHAGSYLALLDASLQPVPYPPAHMHHYHNWRTFTSSQPVNGMPSDVLPDFGMSSLWSETHGDSGCRENEGGQTCYL